MPCRTVPLMKTSAKMCESQEEKAALVLQDMHMAPLERMLQIQNVYFAFVGVFFALWYTMVPWYSVGLLPNS